MDEATRNSFDCQVCLERETDAARNCCGDFPEHEKTARFRVFSHTMNKCPVSAVKPWTQEAMNLVALCSGEMGGLARLPVSGGVLDQSSHFYEIRGVVMQERNRIDAERRQREQATKKPKSR